MNLTLTKRGDYAVRAAISLARAFPHGDYRKTREVAMEMGLPLRYTPQIVGLLIRAGLAEARAGREGGYRLAREPAKISLLDVVEAAEGPLRAARCTLRGGPCHWEDVCPVHPAWEEATRLLRGSLGTTSLADLARTDEDMRAGRHIVPKDSHRAAGKGGSRSK
jgi:Rrf2 family protein